MGMNYSLTWDLDRFFAGGSTSPELKAFITEMNEVLKEVEEKVNDLIPAETVTAHTLWIEIAEGVQEVGARLVHGLSFVECLASADTRDEQAQLVRSQLMQLDAAYQSVLVVWEQKMVAVSEEDWKHLLADAKLAPISFNLEEMRRQAKEKMPAEQEKVANDLAVDGYHGWGELYSSIIGRITIPYEENGETTIMSVGQLANKVEAGDREVRKRAFTALNKAFEENADLAAMALNRLGGFRLQLYKHRGWESALKEPLSINRMQEKTLQTMWETIAKNKGIVVKYLERKKELLGIEKMEFYDVFAPLSVEENKVSYDEGANFIMEHFERFDPHMAEFSRLAFSDRWIEVEDRSHKRPGGFCIDFPMAKESRIFMTYSGTASNVSTLAHELGHAYHQYVMKELPYFSQGYAMNVAETASTFAEMIVADASVKQAQTEKEKLALLEEKLQRGAAFFMDIHARFLFETRFYEERKAGPVSIERLKELMVGAQKEGYSGVLDNEFDNFWISKLHFYITEVPFYNFPYTFGYLFSMGIYARALEDGEGFAEKYVDLLRDTGRMQVEELAEKHLQTDLTQPDFWQRAIDVYAEDVELFLQMTKK
ncbi:M3 family oligoendopeptidase [Mechercharimyces sp. CAU 1602]|uniref:M3 family oligoendopeptidase n=1 Tax=Mechercharimyces sp. CAU 1602 TaxID=2973933 RepID=UPI002162D18F|nr:M3 family oligoendopeptidase [Mechercharimyces sp. CAU 1602]MCS1351899.1 M3 family oligoendopeptidase [Mechercharimyces sp. CAU 1602]